MRTARDGRASADVRDQAMAENIGWLLAQAPRGARMVVWAHNGHVETSGTFGMVPMGAHLRRALGADYLALGLVFDRGEFQAIDRTDGATGMDLRAFTVGPAPDTDVAAPFAATGHPLLAVDLRTAPSGVVADWLAAPHRMREVGSMYFGAAAVGPPPALAGRFDALIFVARTTRARSLPR
ncbi:MAG: erythromycin esterase family protein [Myxococcales bacterium]|nr:erythromycin esterase family protein [Myxococcales bacterium]